MTMYYLNETERAIVKEYNEREYQRSIEFEKEHPEFFSWPVIYDLLFNWEFTELYFMYSWETFWDFVAIAGTLACGLYTLFLMLQTLYFVKNETSLVDDMKLKMYMKDRKYYRNELREYWQMNKRRRPLSWTGLVILVFGEISIFKFYAFIPRYRLPRSLDIASQNYLKKIEALNEAKSKKENWK